MNKATQKKMTETNKVVWVIVLRLLRKSSTKKQLYVYAIALPINVIPNN